MIQDMTKGNALKLILLFSLPILIGNVFQQLYQLADIFIVGRLLGENALAAVGASAPIYFTFLIIAFSFTGGLTAVTAQRFGAGDYDGVRRSVTHSFRASLVLSIFLTLVLIVSLRRLMHILNVPPAIYDDSYNFIMILGLAMVLIVAFNLLSGFIRALGDSKTPLYAMVIASILNIGLDLLFVMVFHWGIAGAVVATVIAQLFAALYCLRAVLHVKVIHLKKEYFRLNPEIAKRLLGLGTPVAAQNVIIAVGGMVVQSVVNRYGTLFVAGFTATNKLYGILEIAAVSFGYAVTTYVGQNLGAGLLDRVKKGMHSATWIALLTSVVITVFVLIFGKYGIALFISGTAEEVSISSQVALHYLNIMSICLSILYMLHIYRSALMGLGDTIMPMASGIMEFLMRIGVALFLPLIIGQEGIFYAEVTAWTGAAILLVTTYFVRMHKLTRELDTSQSKAGE